MGEARRLAHAAEITRARRTWRLTMALIATFGSLMVLGLLVVLGVSLWSAAVNTSTLLRDKADTGIEVLAVRMREHLAPAEHALTYLATRMKAGDLDPDRAEQLKAALTGALAAAPQVMGVGFFRSDLQATFVGRGADGVRAETRDMTGDKVIRAGMARALTATKPVWADPTWRAEFGETVLPVILPVWRDGRLAGVFTALVRLSDLSSYLEQIAKSQEVTPFVLYDRDRVLAHGELAEAFKRARTEPLPLRTEIEDMVVANIWNEEMKRPAGLPARQPINNHVIVLPEGDRLVFWREITGFGDRPWILGVHVDARVFGESLIRLAIAAGVGLLVVVLAIVLSIVIGRRISHPVRRLADAAREVGAFRLDAVPALPPSGIREINEQSQAFNAMVNGLRWFGAYVPKGLVRQLLQSGDIDTLQSDNRSLTVMITDIVGFSSFSEDRPAHEVAAFLNEHFTTLTRCIEAERGTVDKFIGDSVMAFWGAPDKQKDRAICASRAALAMRAALAAENAARAAQGADPVQIRVGIHSGRATVGNIGGRDRMNYTVIGDMVNVAQRLEQLGKELSGDLAVGDAAATILISGATRADLGDAFETRALGTHTVKGREGAVEVYELVGGPAAPPEPTEDEADELLALADPSISASSGRR